MGGILLSAGAGALGRQRRTLRVILATRTRNGQDVYAVIERDNQLAIDGQLKRVYTFTLEGLTPEDIGTPVSAISIVGSTVSKHLLKNVQPQFTPYEKVEGLAVTPVR